MPIKDRLKEHFLRLKAEAAAPVSMGKLTLYITYIVLLLSIGDIYNYSLCEEKSRAYVDARFKLDPSNPFTVESAIERLFGDGAATNKKLADAEKRIEALEKKLRANAVAPVAQTRPKANLKSE